MRTRTEADVLKWLRDHPEASQKMLRDLDISKKGFGTRSDNVLSSHEAGTHRLLSELLTTLINKGHYLKQKLNPFCHKVVELLDMERCAIFILDEEKNELNICGDRNWGSHISVEMSKGIVGRSASLNERIFVKDPANDDQYHAQFDAYFGDIPSNILCIPFKHDNAHDKNAMGVLCLLNRTKVHYEEYELDAILKALDSVAIVVSNCKMYSLAMKEVDDAKGNYEASVKELNKSKILLEFAISLYQEDNLAKLVEQIILRARDLLNADKASVFVVDKERKELYSSVFDADLASKEIIRLPLSKGISGFVASSGQIVRLDDAYSDPRFNRDVDLSTGYRTKSMLSVPIFGPAKEIVAVANLINKVVENKTASFSDSDVETFQAFAAFCGLALHKTILLEETDAQRKMLSVTMELMSYHSTAKDDDIHGFYEMIPKISLEVEELKKMSFASHTLDYSPDLLSLAILQMFHELNYTEKFQIEDKKLVPYILTVRKNYRPVLYHNFGHAVSVAHAMFLLILHTDINKMLTDLELFSMFIGALNHDIDHRGTNNQFQKSAQTALSSFYSTSTMERHHFNHAVTILSNEKLNILERLNSTDFRKCLEYMEKSILATDLSLYFQQRERASKLAKSKSYDPKNPEHCHLLKSIVMTCCDLSSMTKSFHDTRMVANNVYREFFAQGDEEKKLGLAYSSEIMDRSKTGEIPRMQVDFLKVIVLPAFAILHEFLGDPIAPWVNSLNENLNKWKELESSGIPYSLD